MLYDTLSEWPFNNKQLDVNLCQLFINVYICKCHDFAILNLTLMTLGHLKNKRKDPSDAGLLMVMYRSPETIEVRFKENLEILVLIIKKPMHSEKNLGVCSMDSVYTLCWREKLTRAELLNYVLLRK